RQDQSIPDTVAELERRVCRVLVERVESAGDQFSVSRSALQILYAIISTDSVQLRRHVQRCFANEGITGAVAEAVSVDEREDVLLFLRLSLLEHAALASTANQRQAFG